MRGMGDVTDIECNTEGAWKGVPMPENTEEPVGILLHRRTRET